VKKPLPAAAGPSLDCQDGRLKCAPPLGHARRDGDGPATDARRPTLLAATLAEYPRADRGRAERRTQAYTASFSHSGTSRTLDE
jgi:hypothetical protein